MVKRAIYEVSVAGQNISSRLAPLLTSIRISDREGTHSDTCDIVVDDKGGQIRLPKKGDEIVVSLGWEGEGVSAVFDGVVDEAKSSGSRGGGRELRISAKGVDTTGDAKSGQQLHMDNATVEQVLNEAGKKAGITVKVDPELASVTRDWWGMTDESFMHFGERVAREVGGIFKIKGKQAILAKKNGGRVSGGAMGTVSAVYGKNLISWDLAPFRGRPRHKKVEARFFDHKEAKWKTVTADVDDTETDATMTTRFTEASEDDASGSAESGAADVAKEKGGGSIDIDGNASARPGATCVLVGARAGIDGEWRIEGVEHNYTRSGWETRLEVKLPSGGAGTDDRWQSLSPDK